MRRRQRSPWGWGPHGTNAFHVRQRLRLVAALAFLIQLAACGDQATIPSFGQPVADIALPDLDGKTVRLSDFRGQVVLVNFWATWCPPCVEEMPSLQKLQEVLGDKGLHVLAISVDDNLEDVEKFQKDLQVTLPILLDPGAKVAHSFATFKFPETYVVDREGKLAAKVIGPRDWVAPLVIHEFLGLLHAEDSEEL